MQFNLSQEDKNLLAAVIRAEARGESEQGRIAVLGVIVTRALRSPRYGWSKNLVEVVEQPSQFSCLNKNDPNYKLIQEWIADPKQYLYPYLSMLEEYLAWNINTKMIGADHYLNPKTASPAVVDRFNKVFHIVGTVGNHRFYESINKVSNISQFLFCYKCPVAITDISNVTHVQVIQRELNNVMGADLKVDGVPGDKTSKAWIDFKRANYQEFPNLVGEGSLGLLDKGKKVIVKPDVITPPETLAEKIVAVCKKRGYPLKTNGDYNIIGLEGVNPDGTANNDAPDQWNDCMALLRFSGDRPVIDWIAQSTTEPGRYYTDRPMDSRGAARLDTGYHPKLWSRGLHKSYSAMAQTGPARLVRDRNRDFLRNDAVTVESWRGINWHTTYGALNPHSIGRWSAGCCVTMNPTKFKQAMDLIDGQGKRSSYDFILLWRDWLKEV
jgi:hypothetical protein